MKTSKFLIASLVLGVSALSALAQTNTPPQDGGGRPPGGGGGRRHRPLPPIVAALDTNHDGVISADEIANASASLLKLDKNGDGQLTKDEYTPQRPGGQDGPPPGASDASGEKRPERPIPAIDKALDLDGDGIISAAEIAKAPASLMTLDKNNDGQLSMEEMMGPRPPRPDGQGGPGGPGGNLPPDGDGQGGPGKGHRPPPQQDQNN